MLFGAVCLAGCENIRGSASTASSAPRAMTATPQCSDAEGVDKVRPAVYYVQAATSRTIASGSAFSVGGGRLVTAAHVVSGGRSIYTTHPANGTLRTAIVVAVDSDRDLALLDTVDDTGPAVRWGDEKGLERGRRLLAMGFPAGSGRTSSSTSRTFFGSTSLTGGLFSGLVREGRTELIETDTPVDHGNSGGPLFTSCGEVVGMVSFGLIEDPKRNFAVSASQIRDFISRNSSAASSPRTQQSTSVPSTPAPPPTTPPVTLTATPQPPTIRAQMTTGMNADNRPVNMVDSYSTLSDAFIVAYTLQNAGIGSILEVIWYTLTPGILQARQQVVVTFVNSQGSFRLPRRAGPWTPGPHMVTILLNGIRLDAIPFTVAVPMPPTTTPRSLEVGYAAVVRSIFTQGECLNLRKEPGIDSTVLTCLEGGQTLEVVGGAVTQDGRKWWKIRPVRFEPPRIVVTGPVGWAAEDYLAPYEY